MSDDLFSRLFELFNQPGDVNFKLATEVAHHLSGESQPVDPWAAEEFRELTRLAEFRVSEAAPFPIDPAVDVLPVDARGWADQNIEGFGYVAEPFGSMIDLGAAGPAAEMLKPLGPAMVGMQIGTMVGTLSRWAMSSFDAGVPIDGPVSYIVPNIDSFATEHGIDTKNVRLWAALNEVTHRGMYRVPFTREHLIGLVAGYAETLRLAPQGLMEMMEGVDPTDPQAGFDGEKLAAMFDTPETRSAQTELEAFLGLAAGYRQHVSRRAGSELLPDMSRLDELRTSNRVLSDDAESSAFAPIFAGTEAIVNGRQFCAEIERRFGLEALDSIFTQDGRFPDANEIRDPVAWAARVLLSDIDPGGQSGESSL